MVHIEFEYKDKWTYGEFHKQSCDVESLAECIRIYGLKHVVQSTDYDIYCKTATNECIEHIAKYYGLDINFLH